MLPVGSKLRPCSGQGTVWGEVAAAQAQLEAGPPMHVLGTEEVLRLPMPQLLLLPALKPILGPYTVLFCLALLWVQVEAWFLGHAGSSCTCAASLCSLFP